MERFDKTQIAMAIANYVPCSSCPYPCKSQNSNIRNIIKFKNKEVTTDQYGKATVSGDGITSDNIISVSAYSDWWGVTTIVHASGGNTAQAMIWDRNTGMPYANGTATVRIAYFNAPS